ncbi:hypothetical protein [Peribacillus sp. SCS-155]|uniref:hypothetical protein n=1 Tax=Peribacillus sedimenti TaxID=3115297 RepID=UPI003905D1E2
MSRYLLLLVLCLSVLPLVSCDILSGDSLEDTKREIAILDENLDLKAKVSSLEARIAKLEENQEIVAVIDQDIQQFFAAVETRNISVINGLVSKDVRVRETGIYFDKGNELNFGSPVLTERLRSVKLIGHELNDKHAKLTYEILSPNQESEAGIVAVEVVQQPEGWKIARCGFRS